MTSTKLHLFCVFFYWTHYPEITAASMMAFNFTSPPLLSESLLKLLPMWGWYSGFPKWPVISDLNCPAWSLFSSHPSCAQPASPQSPHLCPLLSASYHPALVLVKYFANSILTSSALLTKTFPTKLVISPL